MNKITVIGLDLAKSVFQVHGVDAEGKAVLKKRLTRTQRAEFFAHLEPCLVALEACGAQCQLLFNISDNYILTLVEWPPYSVVESK